MDTVSIVDTSICTDNLGDEIIMDAVNSVVYALFPNAYIFRVPSHEALSDRTRKFIAESSFCFIGGTNLLSSNIQPFGLWRVRSDDSDIFGLTRTVCLGTGWNDYMPAPTRKTTRFLRTALSSELTHAARDSYTRDHLNSAGIRAITTSCPTTWSLTPGSCAKIPTEKADSVVFTLSAWRQDPKEDLALIRVLQRNYKKLYFFPQMQDDLGYFHSFNLDKVKLISPTVKGYNEFLDKEEVDFIGTRLHGGIRALQKNKRALIIAIDNRASEISKDTALPVIRRGDNEKVEEWIHSNAPTLLSLPQEAIDKWKEQFCLSNFASPPKSVPLNFRDPHRVFRYLKRAAKQAIRS